MIRTQRLCWLSGIIPFLGTGCGDGSFSFDYFDDDRPRRARVVHVDTGHHCGPGCEHFYDGGRYVVIQGHRHGPGCGHLLEGPHWIVVQRSAPVATHVEHVCSYDCHHHYWDGGRLVVIQGRHRHGPGCGHAFDGRRWLVTVSRGPDRVVVEGGRGPAARAQPGPDRVVRIPAPPGPVNVYVFDRRGSKWLRIAKGHVHGPGCGHAHVEGHWCLP